MMCEHHGGSTHRSARYCGSKVIDRTVAHSSRAILGVKGDSERVSLGAGRLHNGTGLH